MDNIKVNQYIKALFGEDIVKRAYSDNLDEYLESYDLVDEQEINLSKLKITIELVNGVVLKIDKDGIYKT